MKIYIDGELPKSCSSCEFLVHCDECEGHENFCPIMGKQVGYDISDSLIDGAPVTFVTKRHRHCPLEERPQCEWIIKNNDIICPICGYNGMNVNDIISGDANFCPNCGADMREGEAE